MGRIVDFHTHIFPDVVSESIAPYATQWLSPETFEQTRSLFKTRLRSWLGPIMGGIHKVQPGMRHLSEGMRKAIDPLAMLSTFPNLLIESTVDDLEAVLDQCGVDEAVVIAHHPWAKTEWVLEACADRPRLIPAVQIPHGTEGDLKDFSARGARVLKIHPASDGGAVDSPTHLSSIAVAGELGMPVILHTGCIHAQTLFKNPSLGDPSHFESWFRDFPQTTFVLAHMNLHDPGKALDLGERYPNVLVDTSWQPAEVIGEAVRRIGSDRVLMGSDWPIVGANVQVALERIRDCVTSGLFQEFDSHLILGGNADRILGRTHANSF